jgi:uncharacterized cysteine cluster protein YcgN (CxxCxxCC family)
VSALKHVALRRMYGVEWEDVAGGCGKLRNEKLYYAVY